MKVHSRDFVEFVCDGCGAVASRHENEQESLRLAREYANRFGWKWEHPGWQLFCQKCNYRRRK